MTDRPAPVAAALAFLQHPDPERFDEVAREVFAFQVSRIEPLAHLCRRRGIRAEALGSWEEIPLVPTAAFRNAVMAAAPPRHVFRTSGTTGGRARRGEHHLPELALYDAAWGPPFREHVLPDRGRMRILSLVPSWRSFPESSLSFMVSRILERHGVGKSGTFLDLDGIQHERLRGALSASVAEGEPVLLLGTVLALADVLDRLEGEGLRLRLPPGSRILDTGGGKGRRRDVSRAALLTRYRESLGVPGSHVVGEYGMTELSSQFYEGVLVDHLGGQAGSSRVFRGPAWTRTRVLHPDTLAPLPRGETGLLAHLDLANAWTVLHVLTEDLGVEEAAGFRLVGRAEGAALRGCSLTAEELFGE
jgi:hypothetical protein